MPDQLDSGAQVYVVSQILVPDAKLTGKTMLVKGIYGGFEEYTIAKICLEACNNKHDSELALSCPLSEEDAIIGIDMPFFNNVLTHAGEQRRKKDD